MPRVELHPHAIGRMPERGAREAEIVDAVLTGESRPLKFGRMGFRKTFRYDAVWRGRRYVYKELEAIAVENTRRLARSYRDHPLLLRPRE